MNKFSSAREEEKVIKNRVSEFVCYHQYDDDDEKLSNVIYLKI